MPESGFRKVLEVSGPHRLLQESVFLSPVAEDI